MVDLLGERGAGVREWPALTRASPAEMRERLHGPAPEAGTGFDVLLATRERDVLAHMGRVDHPAYFAFIPGSSTWPGALGDFLNSRQGKQLQKEVIRGVFGLLKKKI